MTIDSPLLDEAVLYLGAVADEYIDSRTKPLVDRYTAMLHARWQQGSTNEGRSEPADVLVARLTADVLDRVKALNERLKVARATNSGEAIALRGDLSRLRLNLTDGPGLVQGDAPYNDARSVLVDVDKELRKEEVGTIERHDADRALPL